jgi:hypothetical protein
MQPVLEVKPEIQAAINGGYFVEYYISFGEIARETFATWHEMRFFARNLPDGRLLAYGAGSGSEAGVYSRATLLEKKRGFPNARREARIRARRSLRWA